jgi:hypothetical protein
MIHARELMALHALATAGGAMYSADMTAALPRAMRIIKTTDFYRAMVEHGLIVRVGQDEPAFADQPAQRKPGRNLMLEITSAGRAALVNNAALLQWHLDNPTPDPACESQDVCARRITDLAAHVAGQSKFSLRPIADASGWQAAMVKTAVLHAVEMGLVESAPRTAEDACVAWFRLRPARFATSIAAPRTVEWQPARPGDLPHIAPPARAGAADFLRCGTVGVRC